MKQKYVIIAVSFQCTQLSLINESVKKIRRLGTQHKRFCETIVKPRFLNHEDLRAWFPNDLEHGLETEVKPRFLNHKDTRVWFLVLIILY